MARVCGGNQGGKTEGFPRSSRRARTCEPGCRVSIPLDQVLENNFQYSALGTVSDWWLMWFWKSSEREILDKVFTNKRTGLYTGVDPTAPSLHVGHMLPIMVLAWAFNWGYPVHFIVRLQQFLFIIACG